MTSAGDARWGRDPIFCRECGNPIVLDGGKWWHPVGVVCRLNKRKGSK